MMTAKHSFHQHLFRMTLPYHIARHPSLIPTEYAQFALWARQAEDEAGGVVAVKALSLRRMAGWKALELFEREAATLKGLAHPAVPRYVDYFEQDNELDRGFFLVQVRAQQGTGDAHVHPEQTCC